MNRPLRAVVLLVGLAGGLALVVLARTFPEQRSLYLTLFAVAGALLFRFSVASTKVTGVDRSRVAPGVSPVCAGQVENVPAEKLESGRYVILEGRISSANHEPMALAVGSVRCLVLNRAFLRSGAIEEGERVRGVAVRFPRVASPLFLLAVRGTRGVVGIAQSTHLVLFLVVVVLGGVILVVDPQRLPAWCWLMAGVCLSLQAAYLALVAGAMRRLREC